MTFSVIDLEMLNVTLTICWIRSLLEIQMFDEANSRKIIEIGILIKKKRIEIYFLNINGTKYVKFKEF